MATTYYRLIKESEFDAHREASETLSLTTFARAYQEGSPVPSGIQITLGRDYFLLTDSQAKDLAFQLLKAYSNNDEPEKGGEMKKPKPSTGMQTVFLGDLHLGGFPFASGTLTVIKDVK